MALRSIIVWWGIRLTAIAHGWVLLFNVPEKVEKFFEDKYPGGYSLANPNRDWLLITLYLLIWFLAYRLLIKEEKMLTCLIICSVFLGFTANELIKVNKDWTVGVLIGFVLTFLFPFFEYYKHTKPSHNAR